MDGKPKFGWKTAVLVFFIAPLASFLVSKNWGMLNNVPGSILFLVLFTPIPCSFVLGYKVAYPMAKDEDVIALLALLFGAGFLVAIYAACMMGVNLGGGYLKIP